MNIEKIKKYSLTEVALLGVFITGLLISGQIVRQRMRVEFSEPFELAGSGLSVLLPANPGWEKTPGWQYEESENCMFLLGQLRTSTGGGAEVRWRYYLVTPDGSDRDLLEMRARQVGATFHGTGTVGKENSMIYAEMVAGDERQQSFMLGLMRLDQNRSVELQVKSYRINEFYSLQLFTSLAESIQYQTPVELSDGASFLNAFIEDLSSLEDESYLVKDQLGGVQGYYYARHSLLKDGVKNIRRSQIRYQDKQNFQQNASLWFNLQDRDYRWETEMNLPRSNSPQTYKIEREQTGDITIDRSLGGARTIAGVQFFLPEPLLAETAAVFAKSRYDAVVIDVLSGIGQMVPVRLSRVPPEDSMAKAEGVVSVVRLDYLHRADSFEDILFDAELNIIGKYEQVSARRIRIWDSASAERLEEIFDIDLTEIMDMVAFNAADSIDPVLMTF